MFFCGRNNLLYCFTPISQWSLLLIFNLAHSQQIFTAQIILSAPGTQFIPVNAPAQLITTTVLKSAKDCSVLCMSNILCGVCDYEVFMPKQCRLFEGDAKIHGQIVSSSTPQSIVGTIQLTSDLFAEYGRDCTASCYHHRYLQCGNNLTCECMPHYYWNALVSMCLPQSPILGASCQQNTSLCREDLNYTCLQFNQCGRKLHLILRLKSISQILFLYYC